MNTDRSGQVRPPPAKDLTGTKVASLTVVRFHGYFLQSNKSRPKWICQCDCGTERSYFQDGLVYGNNRSCGCMRRTPKLDLTGMSFGRWTVLGPGDYQDHPSGLKRRLWRVKCECGTTADVMGSTLKRGTSGSCGCLKGERIAAWNKSRAGKKRGEPAFSHPLAGRVRALYARVHNPKAPGYCNYGGRKIAGPWIHPDWDAEDPKAMCLAIEASIGLCPSKTFSLDRINPNIGYVPGNIRWATHSTQVANRRPSIQYCLDGETRVHKTFDSLRDAAIWMWEHFGVDQASDQP